MFEIVLTDLLMKHVVDLKFKSLFYGINDVFCGVFGIFFEEKTKFGGFYIILLDLDINDTFLSITDLNAKNFLPKAIISRIC